MVQECEDQGQQEEADGLKNGSSGHSRTPQAADEQPSENEKKAGAIGSRPG
jgi:hypothetical protein